ncbi:MAG: hypothetical protein A3H98_03665 [Bacteroidetes bacterium RIFCSPLOWO2_02_FULL_36_8]|nr:MAG: hypothetical protein A3H98_03665 [Bacteroidetes bacterium RIFCSPLOWO2_02_FULL_36_8]OFY69539.1 MAG: hypothetical protein A3G23_10910 [Bacteroidetes bacterium RIFCSPLOWO2_12_FULL_37_12]
MGKEKKNNILTPAQLNFLNLVAENSYLTKKYYFTGGTPLAHFYLKHRLSEDIDLFIEDSEVELLPINNFLSYAKEKLNIKKIDYRQIYGLHTFNLHYADHSVLKVDFNYYPFPRIEKGLNFNGIKVDSIYDIAVNKIHTIAQRPRAKDFIDIYFILKEKNFAIADLVMKAKSKFDWHIDPLHLGSRFLMASDASDYPRMLKPIKHEKWKSFFVEEARKLKKDIFL